MRLLTLYLYSSQKLPRSLNINNSITVNMSWTLHGELGWKLKKTRLGLIIQPPFRIRTLLYPLFPFLLHLIWGIIFAMDGKGMMILLVSPLSLVVGIYFFQDAVLYIHEKREVAMLGDFSMKYKLQNFYISIQRTGQFSKILIDIPPPANGIVVWIARNPEECKQVADTLSLHGVRIHQHCTVNPSPAPDPSKEPSK